MDLCGPDAFMDLSGRKRGVAPELPSDCGAPHKVPRLQGASSSFFRAGAVGVGAAPSAPLTGGASFGASWENFSQDSSSSRPAPHSCGAAGGHYRSSRSQQQQQQQQQQQPSGNGGDYARRAARGFAAPSSGVEAALRNMPWVAPSPDDTFVAEVWRITCAGGSDYRRVLGLKPSEAESVQAAESRYRQLMRILHPDKRRVDEEERAGGKELCDEAIALVQRALDRAKEDIPKAHAVQATHNTMQRMQERQRQQARDAMRRQREHEEQREASDNTNTRLVEDLLGALSGSGPDEAPQDEAGAAREGEESLTAARILELLGKQQDGGRRSEQSKAPDCPLVVELDPPVLTPSSAAQHCSTAAEFAELLAMLA